MLSQPGKLVFAWVKLSSRFWRSTPRTVLKWNTVALVATRTRPRPRVCARSAKIGPGVVDVATGAPPWKLNVRPLLAALIGRFATLAPIAVVRNEMIVAFDDTAAGMK